MTKATVGVLVVALGVTLASQQQPPTFKSNVAAVVLDIRVVDRNGRFVDDLTRDELRVFEDGREQTISTFDLVNIPPPLAVEAPAFIDSEPVAADVASNAIAGLNGSLGRLYVLLLDDAHTEPGRSGVVRDQARDFIERHFADDDRAAIMTTGGTRSMTQEFTNNRQRLLQAIDRFEGHLRTDIPVPCDSDHSADPVYCATADERATQQTLTAIADWLAPLAGRRKAVLFFGQGAAAGTVLPSGPDPTDLDLNSPGVATGGLAARSTAAAAGAMLRAILPDRQQTADATARANVNIYGLDPRRDADGVFARIVADTSSYYLLGYVPTNDKHDGTFRKLDVRTTRPGLTVLARTGYTAKNDAPPKKATTLAPALTELMASPVETSGLTMSVSAPVFRGSGGKASVELVVDVAGRDLSAASDASGGKGSLELLAVVADAEGHERASEHGSLTLKLSDATRKAVMEHGLRVMSRLNVAPGRYLLRVAAIDGAGQTRGSVQYDLDVPDFSKGPLAMSGLSVVALSELARPTTGSDKDWMQRFDRPPTANRTFTHEDEIEVSGEIYSADAQPLQATTEVESASGAVVFSHTETLTPTGAKPPVFRHQTGLALNSLAPGRYVLSVTARGGSARATASRRFVFTIQ